MNTPETNVAFFANLPAPTSPEIEQVRSSFAEDFKWHYFNEGLPELNKTYHGFDGWMQFFKDLAEKTGGTFNVGMRNIHPIGDELVVVHALPNMTLDGMSLETDAAVVWRVVDGKIAEAWDIPGLNSAIRPQALSPAESA
ncbi:nuclear transport factor 2 family protein [Pontixanthobacter sp. CEM42]|uniref:nuclear transport factor 2 family protein n=1 Tax=Pontixanthobacter sp. CEM42 TaxID=2792077 RepID=UPI001ADF77AF